MGICMAFCKCVLVVVFKEILYGDLYGGFKWSFEGYIEWGIVRDYCMGIL